MSDEREQAGASLPGLAMSALDSGKTAITAAAQTARSGARLAVGTFFAGCNLLLDLGVEAMRRLPLDRQASGGSAERHDAAQAVPPLGWWTSDGSPPSADEESIGEALRDLHCPVLMVGYQGRVAVARGGRGLLGVKEDTESLPILAHVPALAPEQLGDAAFKQAHGLKFAYIAGAMANGIGSEEIVEAMSRAGCLGFFGSAGLSPDRVSAAIDRIQRSIGSLPCGFNLIHSPNEPALEAAIVDLYLRRQVRLVDASAYLDLTLPLVRYRVHGIARDADGRVACPNRVIAKVSRAEVARKFFSPPPPVMLEALTRAGEITAEQAEWAARIPVATDMTVEADSGGHTDNRPLVTLLPGMMALRDEFQERYGYAEPLRIGAAGGISTPASAAAAFSMGAAYIMTGSVNQSCVEAGTSPAVREMLAEANQADIMMAPAADMFEMGVRVQVLKRGTMFALRARKLYDLYRAFGRLEDIPGKERLSLEKDFFRCTLEQAWADTRKFFETRDPRQIEKAEKDPKHKMALVFRAYLGQSSDWANRGEPTRRADYQIWCGPAMGAFNDWARGSVLEKPENRRVAVVAMNLLSGAAYLTRVHWLAAQGIDVPARLRAFSPIN